MTIHCKRLALRLNCSKQSVRFWVGWSVALIVLLPATAIASACNHEKLVPIKFEPGAQCWHYSGNATTFRGDFASDQTVEVRVSGQSAEFDATTGKTVIRRAPRIADVSGPDNYSDDGDFATGILKFRTRRAGTYNIGFSPCAMWGGDGDVLICAR
jgi:hypothetical protein